MRRLSLFLAVLFVFAVATLIVVGSRTVGQINQTPATLAEKVFAPAQSTGFVAGELTSLGDTIVLSKSEFFRRAGGPGAIYVTWGHALSGSPVFTSSDGQVKISCVMDDHLVRQGEWYYYRSFQIASDGTSVELTYARSRSVAGVAGVIVVLILICCAGAAAVWVGFSSPRRQQAT